VNRRAPRWGQSQHGVDGSGLDHRVESLIVVHTRVLDEHLKDPMSLLLVQGTIQLELMLQDPLVSHHISASRAGHQFSIVVG
jgi:hypothetical protein